MDSPYPLLVWLAVCAMAPIACGVVALCRLIRRATGRGK